MRRTRWRIGGLYGRLIVSYFLVTVLAALIIEAAATIGPIFANTYNPDNTDPLVEVLASRYAPRLADALVKNLPNSQSTIYRDINALLVVMNARTDGTHIAIEVVDTQEHVLAVSAATYQGDKHHQTVSGTTAQRESSFTTPTAQAVIHAALEGEQRYDALMRSDPVTGFTTAAAAIRQPGGLVLGALAVTFNGTLHSLSPPSNAPAYFLTQFVDHLQLDALYFVLAASAIGTLTGVLISRNLTRRLGRITTAADAWSRGELQVTVRDEARDELGQLAQDLNHMAEQIHTLLATRQELAVVEERNRLARDLHDSVKQHVFANALLVNASRHLLDQAQIEQARTHLAEAEQLAQQAQEELAALIQALRPAALADKGLAEVVRDFARDWSARMGITVMVRVSGERATPLAVEEALFRVVQEALANVARHSHANAVTLDLTWEAEQMALLVSDDGTGFAVAEAPPGVGLSSMRERVAALGGTLTITSSATGTTVRASVPYEVQS